SCCLRRAPRTLSPLPSFPTRRSSDLICVRRLRGRVRSGGSSAACSARRAESESSSKRQDTSCRLAKQIVWRLMLHVSRITQQERSEEHTSELQSREKLVCRLLLEKKK